MIIDPEGVPNGNAYRFPYPALEAHERQLDERPNITADALGVSSAEVVAGSDIAPFARRVLMAAGMAWVVGAAVVAAWIW